MTACSQCHQQNPDDANFCHQCGTKLAEEAKAATESATTPVMEEAAARPSHDAETLWRQFIGPNADHYMTVFRKFSANGQPRFALSWNWPAFLYISFLWFLYRKMYLHAFVYAVGPMVSTYFTGDFSAGIVWSVMAGATGNYLYYWHCREHIAEIKKAGGVDQAGQAAALKEAGGVQPYVIWVGVFFYIIFLATLTKMVQEGPPDLDRPVEEIGRSRGAGIM
ncbi:MAG: DUF2628 domain-containing protein [Nitrospira sp.]|nr:DUF2628 domain-containing protein [Nitrospira sp.]